MIIQQPAAQSVSLGANVSSGLVTVKEAVPLSVMVNRFAGPECFDKPGCVKELASGHCLHSSDVEVGRIRGTVKPSSRSCGAPGRVHPFCETYPGRLQIP